MWFNHWLRRGFWPEVPDAQVDAGVVTKTRRMNTGSQCPTNTLWLYRCHDVGLAMVGGSEFMDQIAATWASLIVAACLLPSPALAQESPGLDLSGNIEVATDYRFRGVSRSDGEPVVQVSLDATLPVRDKMSLFAGASGLATQSNRDYGAAQGQFYAGLEQDVGAFRLTLGGRGYVFPDGAGRDYYELFGSAATHYGPVSAKLGFAVAPDQRSYGDRRGLYVYSDVDAGIPNTPLTVEAHLGLEDNAFFRDKLDWSVSLSYVRSPFSLSLGYVDTNRFAPFIEHGKPMNGADAALVAKIGVSF